tara:strand:+ start:60 stop:917 length:858 start_codon:yes stop_codon:yes gene_type:complete
MNQSERKLSRQARRKLSQSARRTAKKRAMKKKLLAKRMKTPQKLKSSAEKAAKNLIVKKMTGGQSYSALSVGQKELIDKKLATKKAGLAKLARKMLPIVKKKEKERIKKLRSKERGKSVTENTNHKVLTLSVNGSQPEVSAFEKEGKILPYVFKTKNDAKQHCKKVGGKPFESMDTGKFYVEFTKIDGPNDMNENEEDVKELKAMLDIAKMLSDKSPYFKGRGSKKEYIKMLVHKIRKLSEVKKKKFMSKIDAYMKVRKETLPKSRPMKSKKTYDRKAYKQGKYD